MSSSSILGEIHACQKQIEQCEEDIRLLQIKLEDRYALEKEYTAKKAGLLYNLQRKNSKLSRVGAYADTSVLAAKYKKMLGGRLGNEPVAEKCNQLEAAHTKIKKHVEKTEEELENLRRHLQQLHNHMGDLHHAYQAALDSEAAEAAAAAKAAKKK